MPQSKRSSPRRSEGMRPTSQQLDRIDYWLQKLLNTFPSKGELLPEEINDWHRDLGGFSITAIDYAFEHWRTSGLFFPVPSPIIDMCVNYDPPSRSTQICDPECRARHGKGYGETDILWLYAHMVQDVKSKRPTNVDALLDELDRKRPDGAPQWRRA